MRSSDLKSPDEEFARDVNRDARGPQARQDQLDPGPVW